MIVRNLSFNPAINKRRKETLSLGISIFFGIEECQNFQTPRSRSIKCQPCNPNVPDLIKILKMPLDSSS
jgi:hypothetical protein